MKKYLLIIVFSFLLAQVNASHIAGGSLTYTCLGGNDYQLTFTMYRDCYGIGVENPVTIYVTSSCGSFTVALPLVAGTGLEITKPCPANPTSCSSGSMYGVQEYVYQGTATLQPCADWVLYYTNCCRNNAPSTCTMVDGIYCQATLDNFTNQSMANPCNTSAVFTNSPIIIVCNGSEFHYNNGITEPECDSLALRFQSAYTSGPVPLDTVIWGPGYSAAQFLNSTPPITMDAVTGEICMTPTQNLFTIMAVICEEWRDDINGVPFMIGSVYRDIIVDVISCTNNLPSMSGIDSTLNFTMSVFEGDTINFDVFSSDTDVANHLVINWNNGIPDGTFTVTGAGFPPYRPQGNFFWIPDSADVCDMPHCLTVSVQDNACPYNGYQIYAYCITVKDFVVGLNELNAASNDLVIIPNPATDKIQVKSEKLKVKSVAIFNMQGQQMMSTTFQNQNTMQLDVSGLAKGIYIFEVATEKDIMRGKFVKE